MPGIQGQFDASTVQPQQGGGGHPPGMHDFQISNTEIKSNKDNTGGMLVVEFASPAGKIVNRYNLWNPSASAVEMANKELSALCHAVGIFRLDFSNEAAALRGGRGRMEVGPQSNDSKYMEIKRVFDSQGNEPGRPAVAGAGQQQPNPGGGWGQQQPQQQQQPNPPMQQQPGGGWGAPNPPNPAPAPAGGWQQPANPGGGPAPGGAPNAPPWAAPR